MDTCYSCGQPANCRCHYYHKCRHTSCVEHLQSISLNGQSIKVCGECLVILWVFLAPDEQENEPDSENTMPEDKLMKYAQLLWEGKTEEAEALIDSDSNLAEAIWPFHMMIANLQLHSLPFTEALIQIRTLMEKTERTE